METKPLLNSVFRHLEGSEELKHCIRVGLRYRNVGAFDRVDRGVNDRSRADDGAEPVRR